MKNKKQEIDNKLIKQDLEIAELRKALKLALKEYNEWGKFIATLNKKLVKLDK